MGDGATGGGGDTLYREGEGGTGCSDTIAMGAELSDSTGAGTHCGGGLQRISDLE